jgi:ADP-heptose:LPS heptosyltransferase
MAGIPEVLLAEMDEPLPPKVPGHPLPRIERMTDYFLRRLTLSRISVSSIDVVRSGLRLTKEEIREARAFFDGKNLAYGPEQRVVGIGPGSKWASKRWPEERFREVGAQLMRDEACSIVVFGGPSDKEIGDRLVRQWGKGVNASGLLTVRESAAVLSLCNLYVGNDSGIIHLAAAVGVRCIGVYAAQDYPGMWEPYGSGHKIIRSQVECEGCHLPICTIEGMRCLKQIPIETVLYACHSMLLPNQDGLGRLYA